MLDDYYIYVIKNKITGQKYIGSTAHIKQRFSKHKSDLVNNKHHNKLLQDSWNNYGEDNFLFEIICECDPIDVGDLEYKWIHKSGFPNKELCYNVNLHCGCDNKRYKKFEEIMRKEGLFIIHG